MFADFIISKYYMVVLFCMDRIYSECKEVWPGNISCQLKQSVLKFLETNTEKTIC